MHNETGEDREIKSAEILQLQFMDFCRSRHSRQFNLILEFIKIKNVLPSLTAKLKKKEEIIAFWYTCEYLH